jgi:golgin subfamily B member 1
VQLYKELALHHETVTEDGNAAFDAYLKAFSTDPNEASLLDELERLAGVLGAWGSLVDAVEKTAGARELDSTQSIELCLKVARWAAGNLGDPAKAERMYRKVIEMEPGHIEALTALEALLKSLGKFDALIPVMKQRAEVVYDFDTKKALYMEIADISRTELSSIEEAKSAYLEIRNMDESDLDALDALVDISREQEDFAAEAELLVSRSDYTPDYLESNGYLHKAAALYLGPLDFLDNAVSMYRRILEKDPQDEDAAVQLQTLFEKAERFRDLRDFMVDRLSTAESDEKRVQILKALAALDENQFGELDDAIGHFNDIVLVRPDDSEAVESLRRLYQKTERWPDLVDLLESQVDRARDMGDTRSELVLLVQVGEILDERLEDPARATDIYERVLDADPEHTRALAALARLYEAGGDWDRCAEVLTRAAASGKGDADEAEVHFRLARLYQGRMDDKERAAEELRIAVRQNPEHLEANSALGEYCKETGDHRGLLETLVREESLLSDKDEKTAKLVEIATLYSTALDDDRNAVEALEKAREISPDKIDVLLMLSDAYIRAGRESDVIPVMEALIDAETAGGKKRSKQAAVYHQRLAAAYLSLGNEDKGLENLKAAYKMDISNTEVLIRLGKLHYEREDFEQAAKLFRALLLQRLDPSLNVSKADIYYFVGDISLRQNDLRKAKGMFRRGLDEDPEHQGCREGLSRCD